MDNTQPFYQYAWVSSSNGQPKIEAFGDELDIADVENLRRLTRDLEFFKGFYSDFYCVATNHLSFHDSVIAFAEVISHRPDPVALSSHELFGPFIECQRSLSNFLSSCYYFRERALTTLRDKYGSTSAKVSELKARISAEWDSNLSYRLLYNLRNYSEHHQPPITTVPISINDVNTKSPKLEISMRIDTQQLLSNRKVQESFKSEIIREGYESLEIYISSIEYLESHKRLMAYLMHDSGNAIELIKVYYARLVELSAPKPEAIPCIVNFIPGQDGLVARFQLLQVPIGEANLISQWALN